MQLLLYPVVQFIDFQTSSFKEYFQLYNGAALLDPDTVIRYDNEKLTFLYEKLVIEQFSLLKHILRNRNPTDQKYSF